MRRRSRVARIVAGALLVLCGAAAAASAISNRNLPAPPASLDTLSLADKARLSEAIHLKQALGEDVWPGWGAASIPMIVWNSEYSFLVGVPEPVPGWEATAQTVDGQVVYRRASDSPQNFSVPVGTQFAGSLATKWEVDAKLIEVIGQLVPDPLDVVFPFRLVIQPSEVQITGLLHETFHAWQATVAPARLADAESAHRLGDAYWQADAGMRGEWRTEIDLLGRALDADADAEVAALASSFLRARSDRRTTCSLSSALIGYEQQIEWEEGLAKYVELAIWKAASDSAGYAPVLSQAADPDFGAYRGYRSRWKQEISQLRRQASRVGETRFYYTGMAQAVLLDRLAPRWKATALTGSHALDELLNAAADAERSGGVP